MARYDKYDPISGGFRAPLDANLPSSYVGNILGVGLNGDGRVVINGGNTGIIGVLVCDSQKNAGDIVDVMTSGEIVDAQELAAGSVYFADGTSGDVTTTNTGTRVGHTVEATRLVVRV